MAFVSKLGGLLRQSISRNTSPNGSTLLPSIYQAMRHMSSSRLFVAGLSYGIDEQFLRESFTEFGEITEARIIYDRDSGRSRGFGFLSFTSDEEAAAALKGMDGKQLSGRILHVNYASERRSSYGGGGYSQNDGYGTGGGSYAQSGGYGTGGGSYGQSGGYGTGGGNYSQNDGHPSGGGYSQNDGYGTSSGYSQNNAYDQSGSGSGYSQSSYAQSPTEYGTGGDVSQNDGHGSGTRGMADGDLGDDDEPHANVSDNVSDIGRGY